MISIKIAEIINTSLPLDTRTIANINLYLAEIARDFNALVSTNNVDLTASMTSFIAPTYNGYGGSESSFSSNPPVQKVFAKLTLGTGYDPNTTRQDLFIGLSANITDLMNAAIATTGKVNKLDIGYYTLTHEFMHALGFVSYLNAETGAPILPFTTPFDAHVAVQNGVPFFVGPTATTLYGGDIPMQALGDRGTSIHHLAITTATGEPTAIGSNEIMKAYGTGKETFIGLSGLDLAMLKDIGYTVTATMVSPDQHSYMPGNLTNKIVATPAVTDKLILDGMRSAYSLAHQDTTVVTTNKSSGAQISLKDMDAIRFKDMSVDLNVAADAASISPAQLGKLVNLYIAFFNRVPDGAGLDYWIREVKSGVSLDSIADNFYLAGITYSAQTGFTGKMTSADFVKQVYSIVLGRSEKTQAPDAAGMSYWTNELDSGSSTKASLVGKMIDAAYSYKNDATWGWVPKLLANKMTVGLEFAVNQGIFYPEPTVSITKTMAIAQAVTPTDTSYALSLIGVQDAAWHLG